MIAEEPEQFLFALGNLRAQAIRQHALGSVQAKTLPFGD